MAGKKKIFPRESGKYPGKGGKKPRKKTWTIVLGTVVPNGSDFLVLKILRNWYKSLCRTQKAD